MSLTLSIFVCLNSGFVWELYLLAVNILTARFCIRFSRFAWWPTLGFHSLGVAISVRCI